MKLLRLSTGAKQLQDLHNGISIWVLAWKWLISNENTWTDSRSELFARLWQACRMSIDSALNTQESCPSNWYPKMISFGKNTKVVPDPTAFITSSRPLSRSWVFHSSLSRHPFLWEGLLVRLKGQIYCYVFSSFASPLFSLLQRSLVFDSLQSFVLTNLEPYPGKRTMNHASWTVYCPNTIKSLLVAWTANTS